MNESLKTFFDHLEPLCCRTVVGALWSWPADGRSKLPISPAANARRASIRESPSPSVPAILEDERLMRRPIAESQIEVQEGPLEFRFSRHRRDFTEPV